MRLKCKSRGRRYFQTDNWEYKFAWSQWW